LQQQETYDALLAKALEAEKAYYELDDPIMSDSEYDALVRKLAEMEKQNRFLQRPSSPTTRVGGKAVNTFEKIQFPTRMLSLKNAFTEEDINSFIAKTMAYAGECYLVQPKLDGLTLVLFYENHILVRAATRGNGDVGEDVTLNAKAISNIPLTIKTDKLIVRGEVVMHKIDFEALNKERETKGLPLYANARNVAAGSVRQKDPAITRSRKLTFYAYDMPGVDSVTERDMLQDLEDNGFTVVNSTEVLVKVAAHVGSSLYAAIQQVKQNEDSIPYAIDGAVVKINDRGRGRAALGVTTHDPNWAIAFKFTPMEAITTLKGVVWQIGRKGTLTPVAVLDPVELCGTTVEHASLHNVDYIKEMDLKLGDMVAVYKAAEIIPQLDHVVEAMGGDPVPFPSLCPECGAELVRDGAYLLCPNEDCPAKIKAEICYFVSRQCMDIRGMADAMITALVDNGKLRTPADLYKLTKADLMLPGISKDLKADAVLAEIEKSKQKPFDRVLCAVGIDGIGTTGAKVLAKEYLSMVTLMQVNVKLLAGVEGFAELSAKQSYESLHSTKKQQLIAALKEAGLQMAQHVEPLSSDKLAGMSFCITGALSQSRDAIKQLIEDHGGKFVSSVSSNTSYLVAGEGGGSKRTKAQKLGITIITEQQLKGMLE